MSVWVSVSGEDPKQYEDGYGDDDRIENGFIDVAVSCVADRIRIICEPDNTAILDREGLVELHRRIVVARTALEARSQK